MREDEPQEEGAGADFDETPRDQHSFSGAAAPPLPDAEALRYGALAMSGWSDGATRGRLSPVTPDGELLARVRSETVRAEAVEGVGLPPGGVPIRESAGSFDFRYIAEGPVDVPSDGRHHGVALFARTADVVTSLVAVPRESPDAVRVATLKNPLRVPLLAGPAEIYLGDEFLVSSPIRTVPSSGELSVGLGVEERLKIARNTHFSEEAHGMLGGGTTLLHQVEIEVASRLPRPAYVEIRERVPVKDELDRDVTIVVGDASPPWSDYDQPEAPIRGGKRWRFELGASETRKLTFSYQVRIDGKNELVGGNRRERA